MNWKFYTSLHQHHHHHHKNKTWHWKNDRNSPIICDPIPVIDKHAVISLLSIRSKREIDKNGDQNCGEDEKNVKRRRSQGTHNQRTQKNYSNDNQHQPNWSRTAPKCFHLQSLWNLCVFTNIWEINEDMKIYIERKREFVSMVPIGEGYNCWEKPCMQFLLLH